MKSFLTLCFYEYPAAIPHLKMWENLMMSQQRLIYKNTFFSAENNLDEKGILYLVKTNDYVEALKCVPTGTPIPFDYIEIEKIISKEVNEPVTLTYLKTLVFGKTTSNDLNLILKVMNSFQTIQHKSSDYNRQQFIKLAQLFDIAKVIKNKSVFEGEITCITERGLTIKNSEGSKFHKWSHVVEIQKNYDA